MAFIILLAISYGFLGIVGHIFKRIASLSRAFDQYPLLILMASAFIVRTYYKLQS